MSFLRTAAKQSPLNSRMRSGKREIERLEQQVRPVADDELRGVGERQQAVLDEDGVLADLELLDDELLQPVGHRRLELEADHVAAAAALQRRLVGAHQILGFLLDLDVAVAQHAEGALALDRRSRGTARR